MATVIGGTKVIFGDEKQPKALALSAAKARANDFKTETTILPKGHVRVRGALPLPCDIVWERDQPVKLRDGVTIYTDVFRPAGQESVKTPAIVAWSPYGKTPGGGNQILDDFPFRMGVSSRGLSRLEKWEAPDPAYWVSHGYAVINPDPRGCGRSEGNIYAWGTQEGRDGADLIEWVSQRSWCNGKVALSGNSWLAIMQWFIAAERPRGLAAIAPWEGFSDVFRENLMPGGVENPDAFDFMHRIHSVNAGQNSWENVAQTVKDNQFPSEYILDKAANVEAIEVPAYVVASYSNPLHVFGTFRSYCRLRSPKWLRVHDTMEWPDYYTPEHRTDLHRFFDRYLKGVANDWEATPTVRACILDTAKPTPGSSEHITAKAFPPTQGEEARPLVLYFDPRIGSLDLTYPLSSQATLRCPRGEILFEHTFVNDTTLFGPVELQLAVSLSKETHGDADIFVLMEKVLADGVTVCEQLTVPFERSWQSTLIRNAHYWGLAGGASKMIHYRGPWGCGRVSRHLEDSTNKVVGFPVPDISENPQKIQEGAVVAVSLAVNPIGMRFWKGERLRVRLSSFPLKEMPPVTGDSLGFDGMEWLNKAGTIYIHSQGSFLRIPMLYR